MALEDLLSRNNELIEKQNLLLEKLLASAGREHAASPSAEDKASTTKTEASTTKTEAKKAESGSDEVTYEAVKKAASAWLGEHPKGSAEQAARRAYLESELWPKLKISKLGDLEGKPAELAKVQKWLDTKAKTDLLGYGAGIFAKPAEDGSSDDGEGDEL